MEELASQIRFFVVVYSDAVSRFTLSPAELEMPWCCLFGGVTEPAQRRSSGRVWWYAGGAGGDDAADGCKVHPYSRSGLYWTWES